MPEHLLCFSNNQAAYLYNKRLADSFRASARAWGTGGVVYTTVFQRETNLKIGGGPTPHVWSVLERQVQIKKQLALWHKQGYWGSGELHDIFVYQKQHFQHHVSKHMSHSASSLNWSSKNGFLWSNKKPHSNPLTSKENPCNSVYTMISQRLLTLYLRSVLNPH